MFERWLIVHSTTITEPAHAQLVHRFATWKVIPRLRTRALTKPITPAGRSFAGAQITYATSFLDWLATHDRALHTCNQATIDTWHAEHNERDRRCLRGFFWAITSKLTQQLRLPAPPPEDLLLGSHRLDVTETRRSRSQRARRVH